MSPSVIKRKIIFVLIIILNIETTTISLFFLMSWDNVLLTMQIHCTKHLAQIWQGHKAVDSLPKKSSRYLTKHLRACPPEDQAGVIHAISPISVKLGQIEGHNPFALDLVIMGLAFRSHKVLPHIETSRCLWKAANDWYTSMNFINALNLFTLQCNYLVYKTLQFMFRSAFY